MNDKGLRRWTWIGGLASAALLGVGCGFFPLTGGEQPDSLPRDFFGHPRDVRGPGTGGSGFQGFSRERGYNGTIQDVGSSIDPRTPRTEGTPGRSRLTDVTGAVGRGATDLSNGRAPTSLGLGGEGGFAGGTRDLWRVPRGGQPGFSEQRGGERGSRSGAGETSGDNQAAQPSSPAR